MAGAFITTSKRGLLRPLACQGIFVTDCFHQIQALLQKMGKEHALLLAEPVHGAGGTGNESVDWYADPACTGTPVPLSTATPEQQAAALLHIRRLAEDIKAKAAQLRASGDAHQALSGEMLALTLQHPSDEDIWLVGGVPVVINWGFAPGTVGAQPVDLTRPGGAIAPPPPASVPAPAAAAPIAPPPSRAGCLAWLLPLLLLLLLLGLLLSALGLLPFLPLPGSCTLFKTEDARLGDAQARERALLEDLDKLRGQLAERAEQCRPPAPPAPPQTPVEPPKPPVREEPKAEAPLLVEEPKEEPQTEPFLAMTPEEPEPKPEPPKKVPPKPEPPKQEPPKPEPPKQEPPKREPPKKDAPLTIPEDAKQNNDLSFLEGCWRSETDLYSTRTGERIVAEYCFDKNGKGRRLVREKNGQICNGGVTARFDGSGRLYMQSDEARCAQGGNYVPQQVECTGNDTSTNCKGRELGGKRNKWDARFYRK